MTARNKSAVAIALSLGLALSACGGGPNNHSLNSVNQPIVQTQNHTLDLSANSGGLAVPEKRRLDAWFETLDAGYGDRIAIDAGAISEAVREDIADIAARRGLLLSEGAPVTEGFVEPGTVRVVLTRSSASVPGCPNWSDKTNGNLGNSTSDGFGCAVNSNIAAMVADPQHLLEGAKGTGETVVMSSTKAIRSYREAQPSGNGGTVSQVSSQGN